MRLWWAVVVLSWETLLHCVWRVLNRGWCCVPCVAVLVSDHCCSQCNLFLHFIPVQDQCHSLSHRRHSLNHLWLVSKVIPNTCGEFGCKGSCYFCMVCVCVCACVHAYVRVCSLCCPRPVTGECGYSSPVRNVSVKGSCSFCRSFRPCHALQSTCEQKGCRQSEGST